MSNFTKLVSSDIGTVSINLLHCDNCGKQVQEETAINWLKIGGYNIIEMMGDIPRTGDFCSPPCVIAYLSWKRGDELPVGVKQAIEVQIKAERAEYPDRWASYGAR